jgi:DNA-directed RNA polymerase subunit beta'
LKTADSGYLTRRLVDVSQDVFTVDDDQEDPGFMFYKSDSDYIGNSFAVRIEGRFAAEDVTIDNKKVISKGDLITRSVASQIAESSLEGVKVMSVLSSGSIRGVNRKSYGIDPATGQLVANHHPVGVIAAQSLGEPATQLSLDSKHRAGAVLADETAQGLNRVEELFEARSPKGEAYLSEIAGVVSVREEADYYVVQVTGKEEQEIKLEIKNRVASISDGQEVRVGDVIAAEKDGSNPITASVDGSVYFDGKYAILHPKNQSVQRYEIPGYRQLEVAEGDEVEAGDQLTSGSVNLQDLLRLKGVEPTQRYIINSISRIFANQGQNIADKHLEIVIRQMFSKVIIDDPGESEFVIGDIVSKANVIEANLQLVGEGKKPVGYSQLLLGITKVSTQADSFLSAASFQDTNRVLIAAATRGKIDQLYGLKENVILGRKIPVGTGVKNQEDELIDD